MNNNTLEFFVKMKDLMSSGLTKIQQNAKSTFAKVESYVDRVRNSIRDTGRDMDSLGTKFKNFFSSKGGGGFGSFIKGGLLGTALAGVVSTAAIAGLVKDGIDKAIKFEGTKKTFEVLTGNKQTGNELSSGLNKLQTDTILGPEVFKQAQTLLGFGMTAEKVIPTLRMLGDVSMGDAQKLESLTLAFAQVQAGGKLTGQDLLQFINAGFNPLNEIARTTGKSMSQLKKEMEKGGISAVMVSHAFETATGKGGKFNDMMNQMAETTQGKIAQMEGQIETSMINIGERFKWVTEFTTQFKLSILNLIAPAARLEEGVMDEKAAINTLVGAIANANTSNQVRLTLMNELKTKYPEFFSFIDAEKTKSGELLNMLTDINTAYEKRIGLAAKKSVVSDLQAELKETYDRLIFFTKLNEKGGGRFASETAFYQKKYDDLNNKIAKAQGGIAEGETQARLDKLINMSINPAQMSAAFGGRDKDKAEFMKYLVQWRLNGLGGNLEGLKRAEELAAGKASAAAITGGGTSTSSGTGSDKSIATSITGGGPRVININGVNMKLADNMSVAAKDVDDFVNQLEPKMKMMFLRILNSGAAVQ